MAYDFNGTSDEIVIADNARWDSLSAISVGCMLLPDSIAARSDFLTRWGNGSGSAQTDRSWNLLQGVVANRAQFFVSSGTVLYNSGGDTSDLSTTDWQHVGGSWASAGTVKLWRGGANTASAASFTGTLPNNAITPKLGNNTETTPRWLNGKMAEVFIANVDLPASAWAALAKGISPLLVVPAASLLFYAPLVRNLADLRNNVGLTNSGATVFPHPRVYMPRRPFVFAPSSGVTPVSGTLAGTTPLPTMAFDGTFAAPAATGTLDGTTPFPTAAFSGYLAPEGTLAGVTPFPTAAFAGDFSQPVTGTLDGSTPMPVMAFQGEVPSQDTHDPYLRWWREAGWRQRKKARERLKVAAREVFADIEEAPRAVRQQMRAAVRPFQAPSGAVDWDAIVRSEAVSRVLADAVSAYEAMIDDEEAALLLM